MTAVAILSGCGGGSKSSQAAGRPPARSTAGPVKILPSATLTGTLSPAAFSGPWVVSLDVRPSAGGITIKNGAEALRVSGAGRWHHVEIAGTHAWIDGRPASLSATNGSRLTLTGRAQLRAVIVSQVSDRGALLLHRLAELHARLAPGQFPEGADIRDRLHVSNTYWTSGFWPGALWQAAAENPAGGMFGRWALAATLHHFGQERTDTHDVGFMYGQSSLAAYRALCLEGRRQMALCSRLKRSVLAAADELMALAASNRRAGTIPTNSAGPEADTIVDSTMNDTLLPWASRLSGNRDYRRVAQRHADRVAALLVRRDGSTTQAVNFDRATGRVVSLATHQGLSKHSTWSRGEGWALYGFAELASELRDRSLLAVAERVAGYVARHLPSGGVPRWDYDAPPGAALDVSAGAITAAGLLHLASACRALDRPCAQASSWISLSHRMLAGVLQYASPQPPLGLLRGQVLNEHGHGCWCNGGELIFGLTYALEATRRAPKL